MDDAAAVHIYVVAFGIALLDWQVATVFAIGCSANQCIKF
jgi:hypothetical protein